MKAIDYCVFKNRHDMAVVLQEFADSSQQVINIESYEILTDYTTNPANLQSQNQSYAKILSMDPSV